MKTIFKKSNLPFLKSTLKGGSGRDYWTLTRMMQDENGLQHQLPAEIALLQIGVIKNDIWSMCELARTYYYHCGDIFLPLAIRYWIKAAKNNDEGAKSDLNNLPLVERILSYHSFDNNQYKEVEMKSALLTELCLHKIWEGEWNSLDFSIKENRLRNLFKVICSVYEIPEVNLEIIPNLTFNNYIVDGLAGWDNKITLRKEIFEDLERLIEVVFHELGHILTFEMLRGTVLGNKLKCIYGITEERLNSWRESKMGYEVITSEEDPDTLSYGVYTLWATFFLA